MNNPKGVESVAKAHTKTISNILNKPLTDGMRDFRNNWEQLQWFYGYWKSDKVEITVATAELFITVCEKGYLFLNQFVPSLRDRIEWYQYAIEGCDVSHAHLTTKLFLKIRLASTYISIKKSEEAKEILNQVDRDITSLVDSIYPDHKNYREINWVYIRYLRTSAYLDLRQGRHSLAHQKRKQALEIAIEIKDKLEEVITRNILGVSSHAIKDKLMYYETAYVISKDLDSLRQKAITTANLAIIYLNQGELSRSLSLKEEALDIAKKLKQDYKIALRLSSISIIYNFLGNHSAALEACLEANKTYKNLGKSGSKVKNRLAMTYRFLGDYNKSIDILKEKDENTESSVPTYTNTNDYAEVFLSIEQYEMALQKLLSVEDSINITDGNDEMPEKTRHYFLLAQIYLHLNQLEQGLGIIRQLNDYPYRDYHIHKLAIECLLLARLAIDEAIPKSQELITECDRLLSNEKRFFSVIYFKSLAFSILSVLESPAIDKLYYLRLAKKTYNVALKTNPARGVVDDAIRLLQELLPLDNSNYISQIISRLRHHQDKDHQ